MNAKVEEVRDYFKQKILDGDFTVVRITEYTAEILIDGDYRFYIWIANELKHCQPHDGTGYFMHLSDFNEEEKNKLKPLMRLIISVYAERTRQERIEKLKKELAELEAHENTDL